MLSRIGINFVNKTVVFISYLLFLVFFFSCHLGWGMMLVS